MRLNSEGNNFCFDHHTPHNQIDDNKSEDSSKYYKSAEALSSLARMPLCPSCKRRNTENNNYL